MFPVFTDVFDQRSPWLRSILRGKVEEDVRESYSDSASVMVGAAGAEAVSCVCLVEVSSGSEYVIVVLLFCCFCSCPGH